MNSQKVSIREETARRFYRHPYSVLPPYQYQTDIRRRIRSNQLIRSNQRSNQLIRSHDTSLSLISNHLGRLFNRPCSTGFLRSFSHRWLRIKVSAS